MNQVIPCLDDDWNIIIIQEFSKKFNYVPISRVRNLFLTFEDLAHVMPISSNNWARGIWFNCTFVHHGWGQIVSLLLKRQYAFYVNIGKCYLVTDGFMSGSKWVSSRHVCVCNLMQRVRVVCVHVYLCVGWGGGGGGGGGCKCFDWPAAKK